MSTIQCRVITPEAKLLDHEIRQAVLPAWDGQLGVLPGRAPIVGKLGLGELKLMFPDADKAKGGRRSYLVEDGFFQVIDDRLTILAARAIPAEQIVRSEAEAELKAVQSQQVPSDAAGMAKRQRDLNRASLKVRLASVGKGI